MIIYPVRNNIPPLHGLGYRSGKLTRGSPYSAGLSNGIYWSRQKNFFRQERIFGCAKKGFSLVEILVVAAITMVLAAMALPLYGNWQSSAYLNERTAEIVQTLRLAQARSVAGVNDSSHGVYFYINANGVDRFTLYQGGFFLDPSRDARYDRIIVLENSLSLSATFPGPDINFSRGWGLPDSIGTVGLTNAIGKSTQITVNGLGAIE